MEARQDDADIATTATYATAGRHPVPSINSSCMRLANWAFEYLDQTREKEVKILSEYWRCSGYSIPSPAHSDNRRPLGERRAPEP